MQSTSPSRHILFVTGEFPPQTGGVGAYTDRLARALADLGWRASVLTTARLSDVKPEGIELDGPVCVYPQIERWDRQIRGAASQLAHRIGAGWLHVQYQTAAYNMNPAINRAVPNWQRAGLRVAWTYHDLLVPYLFPKAGDRLRQSVTVAPARFADLTVVTNQADYGALEGVARKLAMIPIGSNISAAGMPTDVRERARSQLGYESDDFVVGYFGFLNRSKGGKTLVRALKEMQERLPSARLLMIGERVGASDPTNYAYLQEVEALIQDLSLGRSVQWTGRLADADVSGALAATDALLMPYEDGASLRRGTLMAGLAHGCAVVTTQPHTPITELVDGRDLLYVPVGAAEAAAAALLRIAEDPELARSLRRGALSSSRQFTWQAIAERHVELYESVSA